MNPSGKVLRVAIVGAGALGQQMAQHLRQDGRYVVVGFYDDVLPVHQATAYGPVLGRSAAAAAAYTAGAYDQLLLGIGYNHLAARQGLFDELAAAVPFATFVHARAWVDVSAELAPGCFLSPGCVLDLNVRLGPNSFLYSGCVVAHDTVLAGHSFLAPAVQLAGHVMVAERCFLGVGTTVADSLRLGPDIRTGAGTVVVRDLTNPGTYVGVPARHLAQS